MVSLLVEEADGESSGNDERDTEENSNENIPPVNVIIEHLIEDLEELANNHSDNNDSNSLNRTLQWEYEAAFEVLNLRILTLANAAAAHAGIIVRNELIVFLRNVFVRLCICHGSLFY